MAACYPGSAGDGVETFWGCLIGAMRLGRRVPEEKRVFTLDVSDDTLDQIEQSLRHTVLAACLDKQITPEALRDEIYAIFAGYSAKAQRHRGDEAVTVEGRPPAILAEV